MMGRVNGFFRAQQILLKDKISDISYLSFVLKNEVGDCLDKILNSVEVQTKIKVENNGALNIIFAVKSSGVKNNKPI